MKQRAAKYLLLLLASVLVFGWVQGSHASGVERRMTRAERIGMLRRLADTTAIREGAMADTARSAGAGSLAVRSGSLPLADSTAGRDTTAQDTTAQSFLEYVISGKSTDSLIFDVKTNKVYIYNEGDVVYQRMNMKADYMEVDMETKDLYATGKQDTAGNKTRPEYIDAGQVYTMDTITYNIGTEKAKIKGVATQQGEGFLLGDKVKKMNDNTVNMARGRYTTCDDQEHPHFYLQMSKAKVIPNKKVIAGYSYMVLEDVPIYFPGIPEGFFPMMGGRKSGFLMPSYGEEYVKGFFLRDGGYYFAISDYMDLALRGGFYTLGSWEARMDMNYVKRYKFRGNISAYFTKDIIGEKGDDDYMNMNNFQFTWTHQQDPKAHPNSTFSASVQLATSGYAKYGSTNLNDYLSTTTSSSISYSHNWAGTPFSFSTSMSQSQNTRDSAWSITFPNINFNVSKVYPFRRKEAVGKQRWYEKISFQYTFKLQNTVTAKERDLFTAKMFKEMRNGVQHTLPVNTSFTFFNYLNVTPSFNYTENWYFKKVDREWDPEQKRVINADTTYGFYRAYNYSVSVSAQTKLYGMFTFKNPKFPIRAIRHVMTPSISFSYTPDFTDPKFGFYKPVQSDTLGNITYYSPFVGTYTVPSSGRSMALGFSLANTLEMKVNSKEDTTGVKKIKLIDNLSFSGNYNFIADSLKLSEISISLRTTIMGNFGINLSARWDPYKVDPATGRRYDKFNIGHGKFGRISSLSWSTGYSFNAGKSNTPAMNNTTTVNTMLPEYGNPFYVDPNQQLDPETRRTMMAATYYDFNIPWNLSFNYGITYANNGVRKTVTQTLGFNGSVNLTPKWGITFTGGYDFEQKKISNMQVNLTRDLHCWQMTFNWVPVGFRKSWSFNISVKSALLKDLKYDKRSSFYDNLLDQ